MLITVSVPEVYGIKVMKDVFSVPDEYFVLELEYLNYQTENRK